MLVNLIRHSSSTYLRLETDKIEQLLTTGQYLRLNDKKADGEQVIVLKQSI